MWWRSYNHALLLPELRLLVDTATTAAAQTTLRTLQGVPAVRSTNLYATAAGLTAMHGMVRHVLFMLSSCKGNSVPISFDSMSLFFVSMVSVQVFVAFGRINTDYHNSSPGL